ncbi:MAG: lamin tail domain-containing protein [Candidatus Parcubacteria bacterium]|nr:lamin tail domain-containing protein [Candidatus Parcubacteria bacterium]
MKKLKQIFAILTLLALGFFICPLRVLAADTDLVISEIGAYESSDHEWIEIFNKGSEPIDLTGWKFFEDQVNHGLTAFQNDLIIDPREYAVIADVAANFKTDYPDFTGTIIDSSWTTLNEDGEAIALKNRTGEIIESFTYLPCPNTSLQRIDLTLNDYSATNWQAHATGNSAGRVNELTEDNPEIPPADDPGDDDPPPDNPPTDNPGNDDPDIPAQPITETIVINEFVSDPSDEEVEWIELYNKNDFTVDLTDWKILDGSNTITTLEGQIGANTDNPYFVLEKPKGALNNSGDVIILKNDNDEIFDTVYYGNWTAPSGTSKAPVAEDPNSTARQTDGATSFGVTQTPTKGAQNIYTPLPSEIPAQNSSADDLNQPQIPQTEPKQIIFNEILPNPLGDDAVGEWIELKNTGTAPLDLAGWQISSTGKKTYKISAKDFETTVIKPGEYLLIKREQSGIALNNLKDTVKLISPTNKTIQTLKYAEEPSIPDNVSYSLDSENTWYWSTTPTPEKENIITKLNHAPLIEIYCPKEAMVNELITCDASDSYDLENDKLNFIWQIDGQTFTSAIAQYQLQETGTYQIIVTVSDSLLQTTETQKIKITKADVQIALQSKEVKTTKATATATKTTAVKTTKKTTATKTIAQTVSAEVKDIKQYDSGTKIITKGVVSALPNTFGKTIMYLAGSGIQLYMSKANWPELKIGDLVEVSGTIGDSQGSKRLKLASNTDIKIIEQQEPPQPHEIKIEEIETSLIDYLVKITGILLEKNSSKFAVQDDTGEAEIYINANTKINKGNYVEGDNLTVTGIVRNYNGVFQILPRSQEDIVKNIATEPQATTDLPATKQTGGILKYLIATAVILGIGVFVLLIYKSPKSEVRSTKI